MRTSRPQQLPQPTGRPLGVRWSQAMSPEFCGRSGGSHTGIRKLLADWARKDTPRQFCAVVATVWDGDRDDKLMVKLSDLIERIERLEAETDSQSAGTEFGSGHRRSSERSVGTGLGSGHRRLQQSTVICRKCGQEGPEDVLHPDDLCDDAEYRTYSYK